MKDDTSFPPWIVFDPDTKAEFVTPHLLRFYVAHVNDRWFICDRFSDTMVHGTESDSRAKSIRLFYQQNNRQIPDGWTIPHPVKGTEHGGIG